MLLVTETYKIRPPLLSLDSADSPYTIFTHPTLGISVSGSTEEGSRILSETEVELYYSRFSILESLWVVARIVDDGTFLDE